MGDSIIAARRWEKGCQDDAIRNEFVIPQMARMLNARRPARILDLGAGTGYIARRINDRLDLPAEWVLLDPDAGRMHVAAELKPDLMHQELVQGELASLVGPAGFDAIIVSFTLLEIEDIEGCARDIRSKMAEAGILIVAGPDAWEDVVSASESGFDIARTFLRDKVSLSKSDKFTGQPYPFQAIRHEALITIVLRAGFSLEELVRSDSERGAYLLNFLSSLSDYNGREERKFRRQCLSPTCRDRDPTRSAAA